MKIEHKFPPNIDEIRKYLTLEGTPIFTYGDTIFAPYHEHLPQDIIEHEKVHERQQKLFTSPDVWWNKYLLDKAFRLDQELEAYNAQYKWIKSKSNGRIAGEALIELASNLSSPLYSLNLTYNQAEKQIKQYKVDRVN